MVVVSLAQRRLSRRLEAREAVCRNDHDQARREDRKPKLAVARTEPLSYAQLLILSLTLE
jgi:hypothetical protein